ncbi:hypothetical protein V8E53_007318 [Lactarius tabidus]
MHLSSYTLFVVSFFALFVSAAPVADRGHSVDSDLVVETTVDWAPHRYMRRNEGGGGGGTPTWKRAVDNNPLLQRRGEIDGR